MKVKDLILRLQACDPDLMVVVDGYEGGLTELENLTDYIEIALDVDDGSIFGEHAHVRSDLDYPDHKHAFAVYLPR